MEEEAERSRVCEVRLGLFFSRASGKDGSSNQLIRSAVAAFLGGSG